MSELKETYRVIAGTLPGTPEELTVEGKKTVGEIIDQAKLNKEGFEIRLNGKISSESAEVGPDDEVLLVRKIQAA